MYSAVTAVKPVGLKFELQRYSKLLSLTYKFATEVFCRPNFVDVTNIFRP